MQRTLGSLRLCDAGSALVVTSCGAYLGFSLDPRKPAVLRNLVEIRRTRAHMGRDQEVRVDAYVYARVRRAVLRAIAGHRRNMHLPEKCQRPKKALRATGRRTKHSVVNDTRQYRLGF